MSGYFANPQERTQYIAGMRALLDFLEAHPDVPVPASEDIQLSTSGETFAARTQTVDEFAALVDAKPQWFGEGETHWKAQIEFGPIRFFCVAIKRDDEPPHQDDDATEAECPASKAGYGGRLHSCVRPEGHSNALRNGYDVACSAHFNAVCGEWDEPAEAVSPR